MHKPKVDAAHDWHSFVACLYRGYTEMATPSEYIPGLTCPLTCVSTSETLRTFGVAPLVYSRLRLMTSGLDGRLTARTRPVHWFDAVTGLGANLSAPKRTYWLVNATNFNIHHRALQHFKIEKVSVLLVFSNSHLSNANFPLFLQDSTFVKNNSCQCWSKTKLDSRRSAGTRHWYIILRYCLMHSSVEVKTALCTAKSCRHQGKA